MTTEPGSGWGGSPATAHGGGRAGVAGAAPHDGTGLRPVAADAADAPRDVAGAGHPRDGADGDEPRDVAGADQPLDVVDRDEPLDVPDGDELRDRVADAPLDVAAADRLGEGAGADRPPPDPVEADADRTEAVAADWPPTTGAPEADAALRRLAELGELPVDQHPDRFDRVAADLHDVLADAAPSGDGR